MPTDVAIPASDGVALAATWFRPPGDIERVVLISPATGVKRSLYHAYAEFLAREGFVVVTWDWRGTGGSRPDTLRGFPATMRDWGERDLEGVLTWVGQRFPGAAILAVGHSFGGQAMGIAPSARRLRGLVTISSQSGYWGHWPSPGKYAYALLWYLGMPAATQLFGRFPGRLAGFGEDLPAGVAHEWARWCRAPAYMGDYDGHRAFTAPILAFSFADDPYAPRRAVEWLHAQYGSQHIEHRHVAPHEVGAAEIGHFGFFRPDRVPSLWRETAEWLGRQ